MQLPKFNIILQLKFSMKPLYTFPSSMEIHGILLIFPEESKLFGISRKVELGCHIK